MNTTFLLHDGTRLVGTVKTVTTSLYMPILYYGVAHSSNRITEFYLTPEEAKAALQAQRWSFETRQRLAIENEVAA